MAGEWRQKRPKATLTEIEEGSERELASRIIKIRKEVDLELMNRWRI